MNMLQAIVWISVFLAALSVITMTGLIVRRLIIQRRQAWWAKRKSELTTVVFEHIENPQSIAAIKDTMSDKDVRLIHEIVHDLMTTVSGATKANLLTLLTEVGGLEAALAAINSRNERQRFNAIDILVLYDTPETVQALTGILDDSYPRIRLAAAAALVEMGAHIPIARLIDKLGVDSGIRPRLLREVFRKIAPTSVPEILTILKSDAPQSVRELLIDALGAAHDYAAVDVLAHEMLSPAINIRAEALRALAAIGHPSALPAVLQGLEDEAWEVRTQAAIAAGRIGLPETLPNLARLLDDKRWWVRFRAAGAMKNLGADGIRRLEEISAGTSPAAEISALVLAEGAPT